MSLPFSKGKIKVFVSSVSLDKEVKLRQQRVIQCLEARQIAHNVADLATNPGDKRELRVLMLGNPKPPPQIFNGNDYCGDYAAFCLALEDEVLEEFLKLKEPKKAKNESKQDRKGDEKDEKEKNEGNSEKTSDEKMEKNEQTVKNLGQGAISATDKEKLTSENRADETPISEGINQDDKSEDDDETGNKKVEKLTTGAKCQERDSSKTDRKTASKGLVDDKKASPTKAPPTHAPPPPPAAHAPPPPPPPTHAPPPPPPPPPPAHVPPPPPIQAPSASPLKTDVKPSDDSTPQLPQSLLADIRSSTKLKLKPTPKPSTKLPSPRKDSERAVSRTAVPSTETTGDGKPKFSADELFKGRMSLKSKYDRSIPKTANLESVKGSMLDPKKTTTPSGDKRAGKDLPGGSRKPEASLASILTASQSKK